MEDVIHNDDDEEILVLFVIDCRCTTVLIHFVNVEFVLGYLRNRSCRMIISKQMRLLPEHFNSISVNHVGKVF